MATTASHAWPALRPIFAALGIPAAALDNCRALTLRLAPDDIVSVYLTYYPPGPDGNPQVDDDQLVLLAQSYQLHAVGEPTRDPPLEKEA